jgi:hypothetical protein
MCIAFAAPCEPHWLSVRLLFSPRFHLCVWPALPSSGQLHVPPFAPWALPHVLARMGTSDFPWVVGLPAGLPVVPPYPLPWGNPWDLPSSRLCLDDVPRSSTPVSVREPWPGGLLCYGLPCLGACRHSQFHIYIGAPSLHACALRPIISLCTLRRSPYRLPAQHSVPSVWPGLPGLSASLS